MQYASNDRSYIVYKYTTLLRRQSDVVVMRIALTTVKVVPPPCLKFMAHPTQIHLHRDDILQVLLYFLQP